MRRWAEILRGTKGETLVEIIVSMVIVAIAFTAFGTCAVMAGRVNHRVSVQDQKMYEELAAAEARTGEARQQTLILKDGDGLEIEIPVTVYEGEIRAYSLEEGESP
ncbi:MAG: prepilin-type N-terminal cleavage/methylation domain-containing protein [Lachnospiraceae bacterium]|jgi:type II secretory pathway pseudopilin PulG|nr:prepilin-type N-terminal cleavage/methylation domain-containing protein [Lachnospiraceae bacterium]